MTFLKIKKRVLLEHFHPNDDDLHFMYFHFLLCFWVLDLVANATRQVLNTIIGFKQLSNMLVINVKA